MTPSGRELEGRGGTPGVEPGEAAGELPAVGRERQSGWCPVPGRRSPLGRGVATRARRSWLRKAVEHVSEEGQGQQEQEEAPVDLATRSLDVGEGSTGPCWRRSPPDRGTWSRFAVRLSRITSSKSSRPRTGRSKTWARLISICQIESLQSWSAWRSSFPSGIGRRSSRRERNASMSCAPIWSTPPAALRVFCREKESVVEGLEGQPCFWSCLLAHSCPSRQTFSAHGA